VGLPQSQMVGRDAAHPRTAARACVTFTAASPWSSRSLPRNTSAIPPRPMRFSTSKRPQSTIPAMSSARAGKTVLRSQVNVWVAAGGAKADEQGGGDR
jgi:hypothetical protein